jgi:hypothetical protein
MQVKDMDGEPTPEAIKMVEAMGAITSEVLQSMYNAWARHPELPWQAFVDAGLLAVRGLDLGVKRADPALSSEDIHRAMLGRCALVMSLPEGVFKSVKDDGGWPPTVSVMPVRRH